MLQPVLIVVAIVALGFLIVVHEGGHYVVARWCKMRIERFSIGFGPGILKKTSKKTGTTFQIAPIPFGGFVEIRGMNIVEEVDPDDRHAYPNRPVWQRFLTIFAGPATNYLSAILLAFALYTCHGVKVPHTLGVVDVLEDHDAFGKLLPGDHILKAGGKPIYSDGGPPLGELVNQLNGAPITLTILREDKTLDVTIKPQHDKDEKDKTKQIWRLGVQLGDAVGRVGVLETTRRALEYPVIQTKAIGEALYGIVFGQEKADPGGPIRMVQEFYKAFSVSPVEGIKLVMMLSVYLGLFNLLPLPALDGGRLVFLIYEMVTRRRANPKVETMVHMAGIMALGVVMLAVLYIDLRRVF